MSLKYLEKRRSKRQQKGRPSTAITAAGVHANRGESNVRISVGAIITLA